MQNGSVKSISRFKFVIGVAVVATAMVAVLASTIGVLSSQSTTPTVAFGNSTYSVSEGDTLTVTLTSSSSEGYDLTLGIGGSTPSSFDFDQDIVRDSFVLTPDVGDPTPITGLPRTVNIESGTTMITLTFVVANDLLVEQPNDRLVLTAKPGSGTLVDTAITLQDHPVAEATFSVTSTSPIAEGTDAQINFNLTNALTEFLKSNRRTGASTDEKSGYTVEESVGSNFEDISSATDVRVFPTSSNNARYLQDLGFDFWFYGKQHREIVVSTNGFIGFTDNVNHVQILTNPIDGAYSEGATPGEGYQLPTVAPLLSPIAYKMAGTSTAFSSAPNAAFYGVRLGAGTSEDRYIVQYTEAATLTDDSGTRTPSTFQVALFANGKIEFRYQDIPTSVLNVSKIGISDGTGGTVAGGTAGRFEEFSYRTNKFDLGATSNVRIVYTPNSAINAVIKNSDDNTVATVDFLANVAVGANSGSFSVPTENDVYVGNEVYTVALESTVPLVTAPDPLPTAPTYTVTENDTPQYAITFQSGQSELTEGGHVGLNVAITNVGPGGVVANHVVNLDPVSDLSRGNTTVTILAGASSRDFNVTGPNDNNWRGNFNATIGTTTGGGSLVIPVIEDDSPEVTIVAADGSDPITVTEGESNTDNLTLRISNASGNVLGATTFKLQRNSSMSTTGSDDMVADVIVPAGMSSANFSFNAAANSAFDPGIYVLEVHAAESLGKMVTPSGSSVEIVIVDRNPLPITFTVDKTSVAEDDMDNTVTFRASIALSSLISEDLGLVITPALTRVSADDVDMIPNGLTITVGTDHVEYEITVEDDDEVEIDELFELAIIELEYRDGFSRNADGSAIASAGFTIVSDDTASWSLSAAPTVAEGTSIAVTITSDKPLPTLADPPTVALQVLNSAGEVVRTVLVPRTSQLYSGMTTADVINIPNPDNNLFELNQVYTVRLASRSILGVLPVGSVGDPITYTVTDDPSDQPDITLDYGGATTVNEGGMITARITVANAPDTGLGDGLYVQFAFNTMDSTASAADISFPLVGNLIPMGQRSANIEIQATNNDMFDPGEVFALSVNNVWYGHSNRVSGTEVTPRTFDAGGTIRIVNTTDAPAATLTRVGDQDVEEAAVEKIFTIILAEAVPVDLILDVDFGGTATRNTDYSAPDTVTIRAGQTSVNYTVTVITDADAEFDETVELSISGGETGAARDSFSLAAKQNAEFTITNDDMVMVTLDVLVSPIDESDSTQIDITLDRPLPPSSSLRQYTWETITTGSGFEDISIGNTDLRTDSGDDEHNREFFVDNLGFEFEFYGQAHRQVSISANGFLAFTSVDTGNANIQLYEDNFADQLYSDGSTTNDRPLVAPFWTDLDIRSPDGVYTKLRGEAPDREFIVQWNNITHVIIGGFPITPDKRQSVTFQLALFENGNIEFRYDDTSNNHLGDHPVAVGITDGTGNNFINVGTNKMQVVNSDTRVVFSPFRLDVVTKDEAGQPVGRVNLLTTLMAGETTTMISVPADLSNTDWEADRTFTAEADVHSLPFVTMVSPVSYTVEDDDEPVVVLERADGTSGPISITEDGSVELRVRLMNAPKGAPEDLVVNLMAGSASTAVASDYSFLPSVTIPRNGQHKEFTVSIDEDSDVEFEETLNIRVDSLTYTGLATPIRPTDVDIDLTIEKSDDPIVATITFPDGSRVTEGGMVTARITLDKLLPARTPDSVLSLVLKDGTLSNADVTIVSKDITDDLKTGRSTDVTIQLTEDMLLEGDETIEVMLQIDSTKMPDLAILVPDLPSASFTITDNEVGGMVEIAQVGNTSPEEDDKVEFEFTLDLADGVTTDIPVMVQFDITAPPGVTYEIPTQPGVATVSAPGLGTGFAQGLALPVRGLAQMARSYMITIPAMMTRAVLTVQLTDDTTAEETEELAVSLGSVSTSSAEPLIQRNPSKMRAEVPVLDNEAPAFEIIGDGEVNEDDGTYPVRLRRLGKISDNEIVFEIAGDGADAGDFVGPLTGRKFVFSPGEALSDPILLTLDDDNSEESDKTFQIRVYAPGSRTPLTAPIVDSSGARFASITLLDSDVAAFSGLPATGGPVLPVWLLLTLALTGVALLAPAIWFKPRNTRK